MLMLIATYIGSVLAIMIGGVSLYDFYVSTRIKGGLRKSLPIKLRKSLRYSQFELAVDRVCDVLDESRFVPDIVVGIHYTGLSMAAIIAKKLYKPVVRAEIKYKSEGDSHIFESLSLDFVVDRLANKKVLIVDNSMITGSTLRAVKEEVKKCTDSVLTLVIYDKDRDHEPQIVPDITLFSSCRPKKFLR